MDQKRKEMNRKINMMYRQLGKMLHDDINNDHLSVSKYEKYSKKIDTIIETLVVYDVEMDSIEEVQEASYVEEVFEPAVTEEGLRLYRFCPKCNAGNHPEAKECARCYNPL